MKNEIIKSKLLQAEKLIQECLQEFVGSNEVSPKVIVGKVCVAKQKSLNEYILDLRSQNFFKEPQTAKDVNTKLQASYHCDEARVTTGLIRLHDKKELRKTEKGGKVAYVW